MLTQVEIEVCQRMGMSPEEFEGSKNTETRYARNSENGGSLTVVQMQVCEQLGLNELEFMEAMTSQDPGDPSWVMIDAILPQEDKLLASGINSEAKPELFKEIFSGPLLSLY